MTKLSDLGPPIIGRTHPEPTAVPDSPTYRMLSLRAGGRESGRNGRRNTAVAAFSPRERPDFPIAHPVTWKRVEAGIQPDVSRSRTRSKLLVEKPRM
jgi:DNA primase